MWNLKRLDNFLILHFLFFATPFLFSIARVGKEVKKRLKRRKKSHLEQD
jgi:hypothetical protein